MPLIEEIVSSPDKSITQENKLVGKEEPETDGSIKEKNVLGEHEDIPNSTKNGISKFVFT